MRNLSVTSYGVDDVEKGLRNFKDSLLKEGLC